MHPTQRFDQSRGPICLSSCNKYLRGDGNLWGASSVIYRYDEDNHILILNTKSLTSVPLPFHCRRRAVLQSTHRRANTRTEGTERQSQGRLNRLTSSLAAMVSFLLIPTHQCWLFSKCSVDNKTNAYDKRLYLRTFTTLKSPSLVALERAIGSDPEHFGPPLTDCAGTSRSICHPSLVWGLFVRRNEYCTNEARKIVRFSSRHT